MFKPGMVRFLLATIVVLYHITKFVFLGFLAVYCFFILSGYWVSFMYEKKYSQKKNPLLVFYASRLFRLLPVFYLISIPTLILLYFFDPLFPTAINFFNADRFSYVFSSVFLLGYNQLQYIPLLPAWSLDIEWQFYLVLPLLFYLMKSNFTRLFLLISSFIISMFIIVYYPHLYISKTLFKYLFYFIIGIIIHKNKIAFTPKTEWIFNMLFLIILILNYVIPELSSLVRDETSTYNEFFNLLGAFLLLPLLANSVLRKSNNKDMLLGGVSYVLYLSHWMFIIPYNYYIMELSKRDRIPYSIVYLVLTYSFSFFIFIYFDRPIDEKRKKWVNNQP